MANLPILYDPQQDGAQCSTCPLFGQRPVSDEVRVGAKLAFVAEAPGESEVREQKLLVGASGRILHWALKGLGISREQLSVHKTVLCQPPKNLRPEQWKKAIACCKPRLEKNIRTVRPKVIFLAGNRAAQSWLGKANVTPWYGTFYDSPVAPAFVSVHPAFAIRKPAMMPVFKRWLRVAWLQANGKLPAWDWGALNINPTVEDVRSLLGDGLPIAIDVENTGDPMNSDMLCIGVGNSKRAVSIPWSRIMHEEIGLALHEVLQSSLPKIGHNFQHDLLALKYKGFEVRGELHDTLLLHAVLAPQLPHSLTDVAAFETHADRWKTAFRVGSDDKGVAKFTKAPPEMLRSYNVRDVMMTARLFDMMKAQL